MTKYDWIGVVAYNEDNGLYYGNIFKSRRPRDKRISDAPRPFRHVGFLFNGKFQGEETADGAEVKVFESLLMEGVGDPERSIILSHVVPTQSLSEMSNIFGKTGICSNWNGRGTVHPSHLTLQRGIFAGQPLGMLPADEIENAPKYHNRYIVITHHRALKSYIPTEFWCGVTGYDRTRPMNTYHLRKVNENSCSTAQDAYELALDDYKSQRSPIDILDTHVLSVNNRGDLNRINIDVIRADYDTPFTADRIRGVHIGGNSARHALVPLEQPMRPDHKYTPGERGNPFALRVSKPALVKGS